jgi:hypothetical protein
MASNSKGRPGPHRSRSLWHHPPKRLWDASGLEASHKGVIRIKDSCTQVRPG